MKKVKLIALRIFYSFPLQLLFLHLRSNFLLLLLWIILLLTIGGGFGSSMGFNYLFLDPEYLGKVSFTGFYLIGLAFGVFLISWNTTTYILLSYRFPFLATLGRPYAKYSINNFFVPLFFATFYLSSVVDFQWHNEFATSESIISYCIGFLSGLLTVILLSMLYFYFTNKDIVSMERNNKLKISEVITALVVKNRRRMLEDAKSDPYRNAVRVELFLNEWLRPRLVRSVRHYNFELLEKVFKQNHANALIIQSLSIVALILMSALVEYEYCRIPAAASTMILFSVFATGIGALTYWLQEWRTIAIIIMLGLINKMMGLGWFYYENKVYGLNYQVPPVPYTYAQAESLVTPELYQRDISSTEQILRNWRGKFNQQPPLIIICSSGGGLRASLWSIQVMREADKLLEGQLLKHTVLMTGASGGMLGSSYYRELYHQKVLGKNVDLFDPIHLQNVAKDLANPLTFTFVVNDVFIPWVDRTVNGYTYKQDRGYIFEQQLIENSNGMLGHDLQYYQAPEAQGIIPMMFITPVIINDGRFLVMTPQKVSYMMRPPFAMESGEQFAEIDAIDFGAMFAAHNPYNTRFASALRMSATYPYVLPNAHLPTNPSVEVMDAGFRDNYGTSNATRFLSVFRDWISRNTRDVIIIEIRGSNKITEIPQGQPKSLSNYFTVFSSIMNVDNLQDFHHDSYVSFLKSKMGNNKVHIVRFIYNPTLIEARASLSLHLTKREKNDVLNAIYLPQNQKSLQYLKALMQPKYNNVARIDSIYTNPTHNDSLPTDPLAPIPPVKDTIK
jgi:hypothetical protein